MTAAGGGSSVLAGKGLSEGVTLADEIVVTASKSGGSTIGGSVASTGNTSIVNLSQETFLQGLFRGAEKVGGFSIHGTKGLVGNTFNRNIFLIEANGTKSLSSFRSMFGSLESEALKAGANKISIYGSSVINTGFLNPGIAKRFGYSFKNVGESVLLQKFLR